MGTVSETIRVASIMGGVPLETRLERWSHLMASCGVKLLDPAFEEEDAKRKQWERGRGLSHAPITDVGERFGGAVAFMRSGLIPWLSGRKGGIDHDAFEDEVENEWEQSMLEYVCSRCDSAMAIRCLSDGTNSASVRFDSQQRVRWQRSCVFGK